jgi:glutathione S-transferase
MLILYHHPLNTLSRTVRLALKEKHLEFELHEEPFWLRRPEFMALNPAGEVPVLVEDGRPLAIGGWAVCEYLEEVHIEVPLMGQGVSGRAETRRLINWFEGKFAHEVSAFLSGEKLLKRVASNATPDSRAIRAGLENVNVHLEYIAWLTERRSWLAGDILTYADLTAGAHISLLDYSGDVPWKDHPLAKEWYVRLKSRPSFRPLLADVLPGIPPAPIYADLDF